MATSPLKTPEFSMAAPDHPRFAGQKPIDAEEVSELLFSKRGCSIWFCCFRSEDSSSSPVFKGECWERMKAAASEPENENKWWMKGWNALKKVREWSELVAGPRWKTFIRRFNRSGKGRAGKFQYDPLSYALNFDEGHSQELDHQNYSDFSTRFVAPSGRSRDFGKDAPLFRQTIDTQQ
ncbi:hypothetical protein AMTRI_Chr12g274260 [Amborella trichopoda]|uniref:Uncharacterized protein n=1 Tax=Amborella trichopoda TaxID=13333 RepID=W1PBH9_AMBTC|nr:uncharacterized protein LOC110006329 [Amborella trichopoda]ERN07257.1 hypothetical protein AMTR_s00019p00197370 [Amborella trichopoda]|eukprot:XP_020523628.1 uncharacterized protein LOC110006329 [Amborella trichopoda]